MNGHAQGTSFMLVAGEPSGDLLAAELVQAMNSSPDIGSRPFPPAFFGAGGPMMAKAGVALAVDLTQYSVIGLFDALKNYPRFKRIFKQLFELAVEREPDAIICVDFSGFNRRFASAIKRHIRARRGPFYNWNPKIIQYVSPQVWASRPGRAWQMARDYDLLLSLFSFEKQWYAARVPRLRVEFVGHPMVERFPEARNPKPETPADAPSILLLPGSRAAEVQRHMPVLIETARRIQSAKPAARFKVILPNDGLKRLVEPPSMQGAYVEIHGGGLPEALARADLAITKSGTVTLECAFFRVPAVVFYKTSWPTYAVGWLAVNVEHLAMPNLLANETLYPEFVQAAATPANLARAALDLLGDPDRCKAIGQKLARVVESLGAPGAAERAANAILKLMAADTAPPE